MNTYAWIDATAVSRITSVAAVGIIIICVVGSEDIMKFLSRVISKCPASRFAVSRTLSVIGRIMTLVISISTIIFINGVGVP